MLIDKISKSYFDYRIFIIRVMFKYFKIIYMFKLGQKHYLKPTDACQTKANNKKNTGIAGITSTIGRKAVYGSGKADSKKFTPILKY